MKLKIGKKEFNIKVADNDASRAQGLKGIKEIPKGAGLILKWDEPERVPITMEGMDIPLGLVFAKGGKVQEVKEAVIGQPDIMINDVSDMVFETNMKELSGIKKGDDISFIGSKQEGGVIDFIQEDVAAEGNLHVLDEKGVVQANLKGNERVFSREHTKQLYNLAYKIKEDPSDTNFKKLGRAIVRMINKQDSQDPQYSDN